MKNTILYNGSHNITQLSPVTLFFRFLIDQRCGGGRKSEGEGGGLRGGIGIVVMSRHIAHLRPLALLEGKSARKKGEKPALGGALFGGFEQGLGQPPPQSYSTVSIATQPAAAAAKVEGA